MSKLSALVAAACLVALAASGARIKPSSLASGTPVPQLAGKGWGSWPGAQISGFLTVEGTPDNGTHLFSWFFESTSTQPADQIPVLLWLTGGPACSSELAIFFEMGPYSAQTNGTVLDNPFTWSTVAHTLYVDSPVGAGFSFASSDFDYPRSSAETADQLYTFITEWLRLHPTYANNPFFVFGESYAGHFVPALASRIVTGNAASGAKINLQGAGIGNGLVDPIVQYKSFGMFGYINNLISETSARHFNDTYFLCEAAILLAMGTDFLLWEAAEIVCNPFLSTMMDEAAKTLGYSPNVYDFKIPCECGSLCYCQLNTIDRMMADVSIQKDLLGIAAPVPWQQCDSFEYSKFMGDWWRDLGKDLPAVLEAGIPVLAYSGTLDIICNYVGGEMWTRDLVWSGQQVFGETNYVDWHDAVTGDVIGVARSAKGQAASLTFLQVYNAGHLSPHDQPQATLQMVSTFMSGGKFD